MVFIRTSFSRVTYDTIRALTIDAPSGYLRLSVGGQKAADAYTAAFDLASNLDLGTGGAIRDVGNNVILNPDDSGAITALANVASATTFNSESVITPPLYGVANKEWVGCVFIGESTNFGIVWDSAKYAVTNEGAGDQRLLYQVPLPTNLYGKKLYLKNVKIGITDADGGDYVTRVDVVGILYGSNASLNNNPDDRNSEASSEITFTAVALDAYALALIEIQCTNTNASDLDIEAVEIEAYYDT